MGVGRWLVCACVCVAVKGHTHGGGRSDEPAQGGGSHGVVHASINRPTYEEGAGGESGAWAGVCVYICVRVCVCAFGVCVCVS